MVASDGSSKPFTLDEPRYDLTKFTGRLRHFLGLVNPTYFVSTSKQHQDAKDKLANFKAGGKKFTDDELWKARTLLDATHHPVTGEALPFMFTMAAFVPMNVPTACGMILAKPTIFNNVLWQWLNQSFNAGFNYANRSGSSSSTNELAKAYLAATGVSCGLAVGLSEALKRSTLKPAVRTIAQVCVPFTAVASAGVFNMFLMRRKEAVDGVKVLDANGNEVGTSVAAGKKALFQTGITRVMLPIPSILLPGLVMQALKKYPSFQNNKVIRTATEVAVVTACIWGALPMAIAVFPQQSQMKTKDMEPRFHDLKDANGAPIDTLYFNKGL